MDAVRNLLRHEVDPATPPHPASVGEEANPVHQLFTRFRTIHFAHAGFDDGKSGSLRAIAITHEGKRVEIVRDTPFELVEAVLGIEQDRTCRACGVTGPPHLFARGGLYRGRPTRVSRCKACEAARVRAYYHSRQRGCVK